jgi:fermentation-respiration switch protein FrsA (DUF1100 family)
MLRFIRNLFIGLLVVYSIVLAVLFIMQRSLLYPASDRRSTATEAGLSGFEDLVLQTSDNERLVGWWKPPEPGKAIVLYFHGNGGSLWSRRLRARALTETGRGLLMISYRGYSGSSGSPSEEGLRTDARAAYEWLRHSYEASRIVAYGESLGTGVAVRLASEEPVAGLVLDAPYTSTADVASLIYWYVPVRWLMLDQFRSLDIIQKVKAPILVMHGTADPVIPFAFGIQLFQAAPEPKQFLRLEGEGHSRNLEQGGLKAVDAFIAARESEAMKRATGSGAVPLQ